MLSRAELHAHCMSLKGVYEDYPFGDTVAVYKVREKMFALLPVNETPQTISLKADPDEAIMQRDTYQSITAGYHLNKNHWNTVMMSDEVPDELVLEMIEDSYLLVRQSLSKKVRAELEVSEG